MLLPPEAEERLSGVVEASMGVLAATFIGRDLRGRAPTTAAVNLNQFGERALLEKAFLTGKVAGEVGTDEVRNMSTARLDDFINEQLQIDQVDAAQVEQLKTDTQRWLEGRTDAWKQRNRELLAAADRNWNATLATTVFLTGGARQVARQSAIASLLGGLAESASKVNPDLERMIQTDMSQYFQQGQVTTMANEEIVFKIPRFSAEKQCMRLHVGFDGVPIRYRLRDVRGNSNIGRKPGSWQFTIGPVHPYCYCVLHREKQKPARASRRLRDARRAFEVPKGLPAGAVIELTKTADHSHEDEDKFPIHLQELFQEELQKSLGPLVGPKLFEQVLVVPPV